MMASPPNPPPEPQAVRRIAAMSPRTPAESRGRESSGSRSVGGGGARASFGLYVLYQGKRLTLRRGITSLAAAFEQAGELQRARFHDPEGVVVVDERTGAVVPDYARSAGEVSRPALAGGDRHRSAKRSLASVLVASESTLTRHAKVFSRVLGEAPADLAERAIALEASTRALWAERERTVRLLRRTVAMLAARRRGDDD
jgi:hypothetical protein